MKWITQCCDSEPLRTVSSGVPAWVLGIWTKIIRSSPFSHVFTTKGAKDKERYLSDKERYHPFPTHLNTVKQAFKLKALVGKALVTPLNYALYVAVYAVYALG